MPSPSDALDVLTGAGTAADGGPVAPPSDELLRAVKTEGGRRRRRRQRIRLGAAGALLVGVGLPVGLATFGSDGDEIRTAGVGGTATTTVVVPTTSDAPSTSAAPVTSSPSVVATPTTVAGTPTSAPSGVPATTPTTAQPATTTTTATSLPPNQAATLRLSAEVAAPGDLLTVIWRDPDAPRLAFADDDLDGALLAAPCTYTRPTTWTSPSPRAGSGSFTVRIPRDAPAGLLSVTVLIETSATDSCTDPYGDLAQQTFDVTILAE